MSTVKSLFEDAIKYDEKLLAHYIICLLQEGQISLEDNENVITQKQPNIDKLKEMLDRNELGINEVKLYSLKMDKKNFAFIFAKNNQEAVSLFQRLHRRNPLNCFEMTMDFEMVFGNRFMSFRDYRNELKQFPCIAGYYEKRSW